MKTVVLSMGILLFAGLVGCSSTASTSMSASAGMGAQQPGTVAGVPAQEIPGVVQYVWEEPMVDVVDVPPGLDPEGHYYRPSHQAIVEIRQGRWQYYNPKKK